MRFSSPPTSTISQQYAFPAAEGGVFKGRVNSSGMSSILERTMTTWSTSTDLQVITTEKVARKAASVVMNLLFADTIAKVHPCFSDSSRTGSSCLPDAHDAHVTCSSQAGN